MWIYTNKAFIYKFRRRRRKKNVRQIFNKKFKKILFQLIHIDEYRSSVNSHVNNQYTSDKALPLTVACHFKVNKTKKRRIFEIFCNS